MKQLTLVTMAALIANPVLVAHAVGNDGTRGGGEIMYVDGKPRLRDFVDPNTCEDKTGEEIMAEDPSIGQAMDAIARLDWYFAAGLRREINLLEVCLTAGKLVKINGNDPDSPILPPANRVEQGAVRTIGTPTVDMNRNYRRVPREDRTFFPIHEALHSFIPWGATRRNESIRKLNLTLRDVANGKIQSARKLQQQLAKYSVNYPLVSEALAPWRSAIEFALASKTEQRAMLLSTRDLNSLFNMNLDEVRKYAYPSHLAPLSLGPAAHVSGVLDQEDVDFAVLDRLVNPPPDTPRVQAFDPVIVALSIPSVMESPKYMQHVLQSRAMSDGFVFYQRLKSKQLSIAHSRIVGNSAYAMLGQGAVIPDPRIGDVDALSLTPHTLDGAAALPTELKGFFQFAAALARSGDSGWKVLNATIANNDQFYAAFGIRDLEAQLANLNPPVAREKMHLAAALPRLVQGLRAALYASMQASVDQPSADRLDRSIDWNRLGLRNEK